MLTYDLDKRGNKTMYEYLYELIKEDIADGKLKADEKLPSKRGFSQHLQISVKTVENAYEQLLLEGYIRSEEKEGIMLIRLPWLQVVHRVCCSCEKIPGGDLSC